jgi:hypothetical protein
MAVYIRYEDALFADAHPFVPSRLASGVTTAVKATLRSATMHSGALHECYPAAIFTQQQKRDV